MTELFLNYGQDFQLTPSGALALVDGPEEIIQRIVRRLLTNCRQVLLNDNVINANYIFDTGYGVSLPVMVGAPFNDQTIQTLQQMCTAGILADAAVNSSIIPTVTVTSPNPNTIIIAMTFTVNSGMSVTIQVTLP